MDELEIKRILTKCLKNSGVKFLGVFPSDHIPCTNEILSHTPACYVVNSDPCTEPGTHWVAFFHPSATHVEFFDSFGKPPSHYRLLVPSNLVLTHNHVKLQSDTTESCGKWCIIFLHRRAEVSSLSSFTRTIGSLSIKNSENIARSYFSKLLHHLRIH